VHNYHTLPIHHQTQQPNAHHATPTYLHHHTEMQTKPHQTSNPSHTQVICLCSGPTQNPILPPRPHHHCTQHTSTTLHLAPLLQNPITPSNNTPLDNPPCLPDMRTGHPHITTLPAILLPHIITTFPTTRATTHHIPQHNKAGPDQALSMVKDLTHAHLHPQRTPVNLPPLQPSHCTPLHIPQTTCRCSV
jgi:hypothetical protein